MLRALLNVLNESDIVTVIKGWLDDGGDITSKDQGDGWTALHITAQMGHKEAICMLLDRGANVYAEDTLGRTPLEVAANEEIRDLLLTHNDSGIRNLLMQYSSITQAKLASTLAFAINNQQTLSDVSITPDNIKKNILIFCSAIGLRKETDITTKKDLQIFLMAALPKRKSVKVLDDLQIISSFIHNLALTEINKQDTISYRKSRLFLVGESRSGKTSFLRALANQPHVSDWHETVDVIINDYSVIQGKTGADDYQWKLRNKSDDFKELDHAISLEAAASLNNKCYFDFVGIQRSNPSQESSPVSNIKETCSVSEDGVIAPEIFLSSVKLDSTDIKSTKNIDPSDRISPISLFKRKSYFGKGKTGLPAVTVVSLPSQNVNELENSESSTSKSEREVLSFNVADLSGQCGYQFMQQHFFTRKAVYAILFDMGKLVLGINKSSYESSLNYIRFWLHQINVVADGAPIFLIGTRFDQVPLSTHQTLVNKILEKEFANIPSWKYVFKYDNTCFFPVDSSSRPIVGNVELLRKLFTRAACDDLDGYVHWQCPVSWLKVLDTLRATRLNGLALLDKSGDGISFTQISRDCEAVSNENHIDQEAILSSMLTRFCDLGVIAYFNRSTILKNRIVLEPQWLFNKITRIIPDIVPDSFETQEDEDPMRWKNFTLKKVLSRKTLLYLFNEEDDISEMIMLIMVELFLIFRLPQRNENSNVHYLIPSYLWSGNDGISNEKSPLDDFHFSRRFSIKFEPLLPQNRALSLVIALVSHSPELISNFSFGNDTICDLPCLFASRGVYIAALSVASYPTLIYHTGNEIIMCVHSINKKVDDEVISRAIKSLIESISDKGICRTVCVDVNPLPNRNQASMLCCWSDSAKQSNFLSILNDATRVLLSPEPFMTEEDLCFEGASDIAGV